jgi:hypothetical protein
MRTFVHNGLHVYGQCHGPDRSGGVGIQHGWTGAPSKAEVAAMKNNSYKSILWQHDTKHLVHAVWADNNIVKTLSNCHLPEILQGEFEVKQKKR